MEIRIRETGSVVMEQEFRAMFPNSTIPVPLTGEIVNELGGDVVLEGPQAQPTRYQVGFRDGVEQIGEQWFTKYSVSDMDDEAKAAVDARQAAAVRQDRNRRLAELDWTQGQDISTEISGPAAAVRQALRDVPNQAGFPWDIQWPTQSQE